MKGSGEHSVVISGKKTLQHTPSTQVAMKGRTTTMEQRGFANSLDMRAAPSSQLQGALDLSTL